MRIVQVLPSMAYGDAIGNNAIALNKKISQMGYKTDIYAERIDSRLPFGLVHYIAEMSKLDKADVIIYHLSTGTKLNYEIADYSARIIIIYHNVTPPHYYKDYDKVAYESCKDGLHGMAYLSDKAEYCLAVSKFNKDDLIKVGYRCKVDILPIIIPFEDYAKNPNSNIIKQYLGDGYKNLLFVGRIAPHKKQEDIIGAFYQYSMKCNPRSRLFLVGSYNRMDRYYQRLEEYVRQLGLKNVYFTGQVRFDELLAYYKIADVFICMSEHEGFCVPLIEAMYFGIPIVAYDSSAISDTLGGSGFLTNTKNALINALILDRILSDNQLSQNLIENEKERLKYFSKETVERTFEAYLRNFLGE